LHLENRFLLIRSCLCSFIKLLLNELECKWKYKTDLHGQGKETIEREIFVGFQKITVEVDDEEEVGLIKLENFLTEHLIGESERSSEVRVVVNDFIDKLIENGYNDATVNNDDMNIYKAFRNIKDNQKFGIWFTNNIRAFWN